MPLHRGGGSYEDSSTGCGCSARSNVLIGARVLSDTVTAEQAGGAFARLADVAVRALHRRVEETVVENHGRIRGQQTALLASRQAWRREMTATSDLDLIMSMISIRASAIRRGASALRRAVFRPADPAADQRAVVADQLRRALSGRHAAAAIRSLRPVATVWMPSQATRTPKPGPGSTLALTRARAGLRSAGVRPLVSRR